jgi:hypothetical protein
VSKTEKERENFMKNTKKKSTKNQWNDTIKTKSVGSHPCKLCGKIRYFKSISGYKRGKDKLCKSCSNSITLGGSGFVRPVDGKRLCGKCKEVLPEENFTLYKDGRRHAYCKPCKSEHFKHYQKTIGRFKRHGITKEIYEQMYNAQSGKCYICGIGGVKLHIDHNHTTGKVRSLLCKECNMALGLLKENVDTLNNMIEYLEKDGYESRSENPIRNNNVS